MRPFDFRCFGSRRSGRRGLGASGRRRSLEHPSALRHYGLGLVVATVALASAGCASLPPGTLERGAGGHTVEGRISVRYKPVATDKDEALSGRFVWTASGDDLELSLLDPLGQTVALIRSTPAQSSITFRDGRRIDGATPEAVTQQTLGWTVPLHGLGHWLEGRTDPGSEVTTLSDGRLRQDDWSIRFSGSDPLPKRIDLYYPGPPAEIDLRLVVDRREP